MVIQLPRFKLQADNTTGVGLLAAHMLHYGLKNIPPATFALIVGQTGLFLEPGILPLPQDVCISTKLIYYGRDWLRMLLSAFYHGDDMHLYYNMVSLLYKGSWLEKRFGTPYYIYMVGVFTALVNVVYILLGLMLSRLLEDPSYLYSCAVGFSGVLFAMKVLTTKYAPRGPQYILGVIPVPPKYVYWAELVLIQLMVPNASFVGHLAGILVGVMYTRGPLKYIMDLLVEPEGSSVDPPSGTTSPTQLSSTAINIPSVPTPRPREPNVPTPRPREPSLDIVPPTFTRYQSRGFHAGVSSRLPSGRA